MMPSLRSRGICRAILTIAFTAVLGLSQAEAQQIRAALKPIKPKVSRTSLLGVWWSPELPQVAAFVVHDTTIYYPDHFIERRYRIEDDTLFVEFEDGFIAPSIILRLTGDTLVLFSWDDERVYTRTEPEETQKRE